ncbi:MAG: pyridoxamine 5'-phosphate oxidase family protein [Chordicoccus sp.]
MQDLYKVIRIDEMDYGCEGVPDGASLMDEVTLEAEDGTRRTVPANDRALTAMKLDEGDCAYLVGGVLQKAYVGEFRPMRRFKQALSEEECLDVLEKGGHGVLAVSGDDGYPYAVPLNFYFDRENMKLYFHGASVGHKIDSIARHDKVSFCVTENLGKAPGEWWNTWKSVIAFGRIHPVPDMKETEEITRNIGYKYYPDKELVEKEIEATRTRVHCLELRIEHLSGKRVREK